MDVISGRDFAFPKKEDFSEFIESLSSQMNKRNLDCSLYHYGSSQRGSHLPESSDCDCIIVLPGLTGNAPMLRELSDILNSATQGWFERNTPTFMRYECSITDRTTLVDGRFHGFDPSWKDFVTMDEFDCVYGVDSFVDATFPLPQTGVEHHVAKTLLTTRKRLFEFQINMRRSRRDICRTLDVLRSSVPTTRKRFHYMETGELIIEKEFGSEPLLSEFEKLRLEPEYRLKKMKDLSYVCNITEHSLEYLESITNEYISRVPSPSHQN